jgi:hypothetical protein
MRRELREAFGGALDIPRRDYEALDCTESDDAFVVLKPNTALSREMFTEAELRPLLRQAIVATTAAVEVFVAEKATRLIGDSLDTAPDDLKKIRVRFSRSRTASPAVGTVGARYCRII